MTNEQLRMQMLAGVITESEYRAVINKQIEDENKESLNESMIGGIVGIGAINQIPATPKTDYEMAFEHFLGERYEVKPNRERDDIKDVNEDETSDMEAEVEDEISMNEEDKVDYDALAATLGVDPREAERMYDAFQAMKNEGKEVEAKISMNEAEGGNDWWVKADEELGLDFDGEDLEDLAINADESWQADFAQQVLDIDASDYEDYKNQVSAIYDETNPF